MRISVSWAIVSALLFSLIQPVAAETTSDSTKLKLEKPSPEISRQNQFAPQKPALYPLIT